MSADWQPGDLAECVLTRIIHLPGRRPAKGGVFLTRGMVYIVQQVVSKSEHGGLCLDVGVNYGPKLAQRFRKVPPLAEGDAVERAETRPALPRKELIDG